MKSGAGTRDDVTRAKAAHETEEAAHPASRKHPATAASAPGTRDEHGRKHSLHDLRHCYASGVLRRRDVVTVQWALGDADAAVIRLLSPAGSSVAATSNA